MTVGLQYLFHTSPEGAPKPKPVMIETASALLDGGNGNDLLVATMGNDNAGAGVAVDGVALRDTGGDAAGDSCRNIEAFEESRFGDRLIADNRGM